MNVSMSYPLILASGSLRRRQLLRDGGYEFEVVEPRYEEPVLPNDSVLPKAWAEALAYYKARGVAFERPEAVVIGADTIVVNGGQIIGKPRDEEHAREILKNQFVGRNEVITGLAVVLPGQLGRIITHVRTVLMMRAMTEQELEEYLAAGTWQGKAGAYAYQEGGDNFVEAIEGSESNVVGLPMEKLGEIFEMVNRWQNQSD